MSNLDLTPARAVSPSAGSRTKTALRFGTAINVALGLFIFGCSSDGSGGEPATAGTGPGIGGSPVSSGGALTSNGGAPAGSGGTVASGGAAAGSPAVPAGGTVASGGTAAGGGGNATPGGNTSKGGESSGNGGVPSSGSGGASGGGAGAPVSGGAGPQGGSVSGGSGGGAQTAGAGGGKQAGGAPGAGGSGSGTCQKGTTKGAEVLFIGESFVAASSIPEETTKLARAAGSLGANESYVDKSVSGTWIGNGASNSIPNQYKNNSNGVRFVLMNGGGNDCWQGGKDSDRTNALNAAKSLFQEMGTKGVEKVLYFFYPDPIGSQFASLTACLNLLRPDMKALCDAQTAPKCYWVDLRETWNGHPEYTSDGIHVAGPGNVPTATAIWKGMEANCIAP